MSKYLFILNDSPYSSQRSYNALRLVGAVANSETETTIFLLGDGVVNGVRLPVPG
jgi:uncharacterized protein involved in oxidation of intracellular sulfur